MILNQELIQIPNEGDLQTLDSHQTMQPRALVVGIDEEGDTALLHHACIAGDYRVAKSLIDKGIDINHIASVSGACGHSVRKGFLQGVRIVSRAAVPAHLYA